MVDVCGLCDLGYEGHSWTFEKKVSGGSFCWVRLDRALASPEWSSNFLLARVRNLSASASDHGPVLLTWKEEEKRR
jgi:endonuclease/exonuclease/phosphatase family metal-dependent hydrolase